MRFLLRNPLNRNLNYGVTGNPVVNWTLTAKYRKGFHFENGLFPVFKLKVWSDYEIRSLIMDELQSSVDSPQSMTRWVVLLAVAIVDSMAATLDGFNVESNLLLPTDQLDSIPQRKKVIKFIIIIIIIFFL